ncbi:MAG TPA: hypothetical protein VJU86_10840 [Pyrinomonadaceae bacterium]|nr:hypothetical protein [Pyrinomonadaceae bacterium]
MPKTTRAKAAKKRVTVEKLPDKTRKLTAKETKKVQGGTIRHKMFALVDRTN